jgi:hypothetical protein
LPALVVYWRVYPTCAEIHLFPAYYFAFGVRAANGAAANIRGRHLVAIGAGCIRAESVFACKNALAGGAVVDINAANGDISFASHS